AAPPQVAAREVSEPANSRSRTAATPARSSPDYLTITVAVGGASPSTKIDLPKEKNSPVTLISFDSGDTKATLRGSAYLVDFRPVLSLRNTGAKRVRSVALTMLASETTAGGKA